MANAWARDRATRFYLGMALVFLVSVAIGFSTTYILPMARRSFSAPVVVHLHGAASLSWVLLLIAQTWFVRSVKTPLHRRLGILAVPVAVTIWLSGILTAHWAVERDLPSLGATATSALAGSVTGLSIFLALVIAAIGFRRRADWHKRLILLATIALLWPAFFRFRHVLPFVPSPEIWLALVLADAPILAAAIRDRWRFGRIHPVWAVLGPVLFVEQSLELLLFDSPAWRKFGEFLYALLG